MEKGAPLQLARHLLLKQFQLILLRLRVEWLFGLLASSLSKRAREREQVARWAHTTRAASRDEDDEREEKKRSEARG